jgi:hypothetical protein
MQFLFIKEQNFNTYIERLTMNESNLSKKEADKQRRSSFDHQIILMSI